MRRVQAILKSPSYRPADTDTEFLAEDDLRGVRLQIDYLKPELLLREQEIEQTIVVFGSTRICEPAAALRKVQGLRARLEADTEQQRTSASSWRLPSEFRPKAVTMRSPANLDIWWRQQITALANTTRPS